MFGNADYTNLTEDSFNFLYYVREISGVLPCRASLHCPALYFQAFVSSMDLITPNYMDLITTSEDCNFSLVQLETRIYIGALVMPKLTEVTCGNVWFENTSSTCKSINWTDIIDDGELEELLSCNTTQPRGKKMFI